MTAPSLLPPLIEDLSLSYRLRAAKGQPGGLVLLLHGVGSNETALAGLAALLPEDLSVALVRSPFALSPSTFCAFAVNFTANGPIIDSAAAELSRQRLVQFVGELQQRTHIPPARTLVAGFSQGGIMSASLALTSPHTVAGFAILSGRILPEIAQQIAAPEALVHLEALLLHGEQDNTLPIVWAERSANLLHKLGVTFTTQRYPARHEITQEMAQDFVAWVSRLLHGTKG